MLGRTGVSDLHCMYNTCSSPNEDRRPAPYAFTSPLCLQRPNSIVNQYSWGGGGRDRERERWEEGGRQTDRKRERVHVCAFVQEKVQLDASESYIVRLHVHCRYMYTVGTCTHMCTLYIHCCRQHFVDGSAGISLYSDRCTQLY